jgi:hypothetical protein
MLDNEAVIPEIVGRMGHYLADILAIEGGEDDDLTSIELSLRDEFSNDADAPQVPAGIAKPSENIPAKCAEYATYD